MWQVSFHPLVLKEDFKKLNRSTQQKIVKAIRKKLCRDPKSYGKPLTGELKGYWRLRVGEYRVIYTIVEDQVLVRVLKIGIRRDAEVYEAMLRRLPKLRFTAK